jgi:L-aminopeptidase/D-esterase-like protein
MGDGPHFWAWALERDREFGGLPPPASGVELRVSHQRNAGRNPAAASPRGNTTIACVATNATLDKGWCKRFAVMAHDGLARAIRPSHTPQDGDAVFALATGRASGPSSPVALSELGTLAADCLARAAARAVYAAESLGAMTSWRERFGK